MGSPFTRLTLEIVLLDHVFGRKFPNYQIPGKAVLVMF